MSNSAKKHANLSGTGHSRVKQDEFVRLPGDGDSSRELRCEALGMADLEGGGGGGGDTEVIHVKQSWTVDSQKVDGRR